LSARQKLILSGLYFSKFDAAGLKSLGFASFAEAFNVIGYALGARPASIKNYRDEFDPFFPNHRKGWHGRPIREYCRELYEHYKDLEQSDFTNLVRSFFGSTESETVGMSDADQDDGNLVFMRRLVTGLAAEHYFESIWQGLPEFRGLMLENTTAFGCGYDFRLRSEPQPQSFLAVEVKGLMGPTGSLAMTPKEYGVASALKNRFFLFIVTNFRDVPCHTIYQDPVNSVLNFRKIERVAVQVSWLTSI